MAQDAFFCARAEGVSGFLTGCLNKSFVIPLAPSQEGTQNTPGPKTQFTWPLFPKDLSLVRRQAVEFRVNPSP